VNAIEELYPLSHSMYLISEFYCEVLLTICEQISTWIF
jgi:hypothetical protein